MKICVICRTYAAITVYGTVLIEYKYYLNILLEFTYHNLKLRTYIPTSSTSKLSFPTLIYVNRKKRNKHL